MSSDVVAVLSAMGGAVVSALLREAQQVMADHRAATAARRADVSERLAALERQVDALDDRKEQR